MSNVQWGRVVTSASKAIILASGPSLYGFDLNRIARLRDETDACVIAVNGASLIASFADVWFTLDPHNLNDRLHPVRGRMWYAAVPEDFGTKFARIPTHRFPPPPQVTYLHRLVGNGPLQCKYGLSEDPSSIYTGNSGYGALGLAYLMGATRILLLGIDGTKGYFYNSRAHSGSLAHLPRLFESAIPQLEKRGITVLNGSRESIVTCFPRYSVEESLEAFKGD